MVAQCNVYPLSHKSSIMYLYCDPCTYFMYEFFSHCIFFPLLLSCKRIYSIVAHIHVWCVQYFRTKREKKRRENDRKCKKHLKMRKVHFTSCECVYSFLKFSVYSFCYDNMLCKRSSQMINGLNTTSETYTTAGYMYRIFCLIFIFKQKNYITQETLCKFFVEKRREMLKNIFERSDRNCLLKLFEYFAHKLFVTFIFRKTFLENFENNSDNCCFCMTRIIFFQFVI